MIPLRGEMGTPKAAVVHKHFRLDATKLKRAQQLLGAPTETETVERALDRAIAEEEADRRVREAHEVFFSSGIEIRDVFGASGVGAFGEGAHGAGARGEGLLGK
jgi:hypothetical protein